MPHFSDSAIRDLEEIDDYSVRQWGERRAEQYLAEISACCDRLTTNPRLGRPCEEISSGLRRIAQGKHVVFYTVRDEEIFVWRILHEGMIPMRHVFRESNG